MLVRFVVENVYSFGEACEFDMLPQPRLRALGHHKYKVVGQDLLKLGAIYGSNGAGKSNLVKSLDLLRNIVLGGTIHRLEAAKFKFSSPDQAARQLLAIEFVQGNVPFYYGLEVKGGAITCEELYRSGLGDKEDELVYERKLDEAGKLQLKFPPDPEHEMKNKIFIEVLSESYIKPEQAVLKLLAEHEKGTVGLMAQLAQEWFSSTLRLVTPETKASGLPQFLDVNEQYKQFADDLVSSFDLGISHLVVRRQLLKEYLGDSRLHEYDRIVELLRNSPSKSLHRANEHGGSVVVVREGDELIAKTLQLTHRLSSGDEQIFEVGEESDGTIRLLDFIPVLKGLADGSKVFVIDEIERSVHAILIKEIIRKFSQDESSRGQLIFTTHESNLLDQEILRQDEIWFAEKDQTGCTELYSLSDYKEHHTLDIRKGYLQGRYGAVPFMGNFQDLNWHRNASQH